MNVKSDEPYEREGGSVITEGKVGSPRLYSEGSFPNKKKYSDEKEVSDVVST